MHTQTKQAFRFTNRQKENIAGSWHRIVKAQIYPTRTDINNCKRNIRSQRQAVQNSSRCPNRNFKCQKDLKYCIAFPERQYIPI